MKERYLAAATYDEYLASVVANRELWHDLTDRVQIDPEDVARLAALGGQWHLLVMSEDWCGDAVNTVPVVARLAALAPNVDLRVVGREANPDLMDAHLTNGSRSIPVVIALDENYVERAWWGPRPTLLQQWVRGEGLELPKADRYREIRRWYARDRGRSTVREVTDAVARGAAERDTGRAA